MRRCSPGLSRRHRTRRAARRRGVLPVILAGVLLTVATCAPPDHPRALAPELPDAAIELLRPDTLRTVRVASGVVYRYVWSAAGPWAIHLLEADVSSCRVGLSVVRAPGDPGEEDARIPVSRLLGLAPSGSVAAVNGDFFTPEGSPRGAELSTRGFRASARRPALSWSPTEGPDIGVAEVSAGRLETAPGDARPQVLLGGFPELLRDGVPVGDLEVSSLPSFAGVRHPRTAVGFSHTAPRLWAVVVEGRQAPRSAGMTLPELAELLSALGADEALNLDGGGSSVMVLGVRPVSRPSEDGRERAVANALVVRSTPTLCDSSNYETD